MKRVAILCPGRGAYSEKTLRSLDANRPMVQRAQELRQARGLEGLLELDQAERFDPARHLRPANASMLIWLTTMLDCEQLAPQSRPVVVAGNSMGWYTALAVAGALSFEDGFALVQEMALLQEQGVRGGQVIYPLVDDQWQLDAARVAAVEGLLAQDATEVFPSIHLGGLAVLAGTEAGIASALQSLPKVRLGANTYPFRLLQHGPYHTPLVEAVSRGARERLVHVTFRAPHTPLVDGTGAVHTPMACDVQRLRDYTLGEQVCEPYDFSRSVRVLLREFAPEQLVLPGPGNTLGGVAGQILVQEGWRGLHSKSDFELGQMGPLPAVRSLRR